jgi:hypothetical protein
LPSRRNRFRPRHAPHWGALTYPDEAQTSRRKARHPAGFFVSRLRSLTYSHAIHASMSLHGEEPSAAVSILDATHSIDHALQRASMKALVLWQISPMFPTHSSR